MVPARQRTAAWLWWLMPMALVAGWFIPYVGFAVIACMLAPVLVGVWRGRHWCGWMCPRGAFFDYVMGRFTGKRPAPAWLRSRGFRIGVLAFLMGMLTVQLTLAYPNVLHMGRVFVTLVGVTTVVGIVLAVLYKPRTWCTFCPMGTMASWVSHGKQPLTVAPSCVNCHACEKVCPMSLIPQQPGPTHADCIKCTACVARCPKKALSFGKQVPAETKEDVAA